MFTLLFIFIVGFLASFIGTLSGGGGGLLSIPALIFLGLPPHVAIATNKFGALGGNVSSIFRFKKSKKIVTKYLIPLTIFCVTGTIIGTKILINIDKNLLSYVIGIILLIIAPILLFRRNFGIEIRKVSEKSVYFGYLGYFFVGIYDGFFGGGAGIFAQIVLVGFMGLTFIKSIATDRIPFFFGLSISILILFFAGYINIFYGIILLAGMSIGGYLGAHTAIEKGNKFVRIALISVVIISAIKLLFF